MLKMTTLNIVELIEKNPITRLSNTYQNRFLTKIKCNFTSNDQQLFIASFYSFLNYSKTDFVIDLDDIWKWLGFNQKYNAKRLLERYFILDIDYKILLFRTEEQDSDEKKHGGHNKETFMLTINAFKRFCLKAGTKKADEIHNYYIKLEETLHEVICEETNEMKLQLQQANDKVKEIAKVNENDKKTIEKLKQDNILERHHLLLREFGSAGAIVYILRVKSFENGEYIIKIGESRRGISGRYNEHKSHYEEAILLDCFNVARSKDFESFLHNHEKVRLNQVKDLQGHENENELFLIGKHLSYKILLNIIKETINTFNEMDYNDIQIKLQTIMNAVIKENTAKIEQTNPNLTQILENQEILLQKMTQQEKKINEILEKINSSHTRTTTNFGTPLPTIGPRLQKINPETMQLVKVYETVTECMNENCNIKRPSINKAIQENTIYCGFRWALVDRELDPNILHNVKPTKQTKVQNIGYIAKLNFTKTEIMNVYLDRKQAAILNGYQSISALDIPVKKFTVTNGNYYILYENCSDELKKDFVQRNNGEPPLLYKNGIGQYDKHNRLLREFVCKYDCIRILKMSDKTLAKTLDKNISYNSMYYKTLKPKLKCFV